MTCYVCAYFNIAEISAHNLNISVIYIILLHIHPLLGNGSVDKFPRWQILGKKSITMLRNNRGMSVNILTATNTGNNRRTAVSMQRPVNTTLRTWQQYSGNYFLFGQRQANARNNRTYIARKRSCKHASVTKEDGVFGGVRAEELPWRQWALRVSSR
jgi:hypothetical protein